ncbi:hypothetical protein EDC01DRAFT_467754 [Geopyxis carbonaria]|nr:hypothetical protein EDC01DRAFT_467754 [Geopyxis carbonaria]
MEQMHTNEVIRDHIYSPYCQLAIMNFTQCTIKNTGRYKFKRLELLMVYLAATHKCIFLPGERNLFEKDINWSVRISNQVLMWKMTWPVGCSFAMGRWQSHVTAIDDTDVVYFDNPLPLLNGRQNPNGLGAKVEQLLFSCMHVGYIYILPPGRQQLPFFRRCARTRQVPWNRLSREQYKNFFENVSGWKECLRGMALYLRIDGDVKAGTREWLQHMVVVRKRRPNPEEWESDHDALMGSLNIGWKLCTSGAVQLEPQGKIRRSSW